MRKKAIVLFVISIIYILGFPILKNKVFDAKYIITLEVVGEGNPLSKGTEVWIDSIKQDGTQVNFAALILNGGWENRGRLFNPGTESTSWNITIRSKENFRIDFVTNPYSGMVRIVDYEGNMMEFDLYSEEEGIMSYILDY